MIWNAGSSLPRVLQHSPNVQAHELEALSIARTLFVNACFGKRRLHDALSPGLNIFVDVVEQRMLACQAVTNDLLSRLWEAQPELSYLERQFRTSTVIVQLLKSATEHTSIDDIATEMFDQLGVSSAVRRDHEAVVRQLIYAAIGWSTLLFNATLSSAGKVSFSDTVDNSLTPGRPVGAVLRNHGLMPIACPPGLARSQGLPQLLSVTQLNFFSLSRLGDVTITWIDNLSEHCSFDRYSRKKDLKLFRLPSICSSMCLDESNTMVIERLFRAHNCKQKCQQISASVTRSYLAEVLLSYRLFFGQHRPSRQVFNKEETEKAKVNGALDPLLKALCGEANVPDYYGASDLLRERGVYNADVNFPHLGARLMELADYSTTQRPRNLFEVWNDERDPEKLLTFRAILIVGAISISLSIVQVIIGIVQIMLAAKNVG